jgi:glycine oxidase
VTTRETTAVIGGGIVGASIAWRLAQHGKRVVLFDKGRIGEQASWAGAGMLAPGGEVEKSSSFSDLCIESRRLYPDFIHQLTEESGEPIDYQECGALDLAYSETEWADLKRRAAVQASLGVLGRELSTARVRAFSPYVQMDALTGALFFAEDATVDPRDVMRALKVACANRDVDLRENTPAEQLAVTDTEVIVNGTAFSHAVLAAGAWSGDIAVSGVPALPASEPVKGHLLGFDLQLGACPTILRRQHTYFLQRGNGRLITGASLERVGYNSDIDSQIVRKLHEEATELLPILEKLQPADAWIGFRPYSESLHVGAWHGSRLHLAYGHFRNGILLAPVTAKKIAEALV